MKLLLDILLKKEKTKNPPIWLMRQAGRYLPEYKETRKEAGSFLNLCYNPELASKVTLQPITRFGFDAAIIFSDILVVPHILGLDVKFLEGEGPKLEIIKEEKDLEKLIIKTKESSEKIQKICKALELTREALDKDKTLIGFAGSPWTVLTYMISEKKHDFDYCRKFAYEKKSLLIDLIEIITEQTIIYLKSKIDSGAEVLQLFDSWSGILTEEQFFEFVIKPTKKIISEIKNYSPLTPIIGFPKGANLFLEDYIKETGIDGLSIDQFVPLKYAAKLQEKIVIQGNLDPLVLFLSQNEIKRHVDKIMQELSGGNFIFNLGHGIMQHTPIENVKFLVEYVRNSK